MGKITFRADDDLVDELEAFEASKSEVMREALRAYLDARNRDPRRRNVSRRARDRPGTTEVDDSPRSASIDDLVRERVDELLDRRLGDRRGPQDVNVTVSLEGVDDRPRRARPTAGVDADADGRMTRDRSTDRAERSDEHRDCGRCGEAIAADHVYCPNCGEKASRRVFCDCGDEVRSDWAFCPSCGRRTPAADVLDST